MSTLVVPARGQGRQALSLLYYIEGLDDSCLWMPPRWRPPQPPLRVGLTPVQRLALLGAWG